MLGRVDMTCNHLFIIYPSNLGQEGAATPLHLCKAEQTMLRRACTAAVHETLHAHASRAAAEQLQGLHTFGGSECML